MRLAHRPRAAFQPTFREQSDRKSNAQKRCCDVPSRRLLKCDGQACRRLKIIDRAVSYLKAGRSLARGPLVLPKLGPSHRQRPAFDLPVTTSFQIQYLPCD